MAQDDGVVKILKSLRLGTSHRFPKTAGWSLETLFRALQECTVVVGWGLGIPYPSNLPEGDSAVQFPMLATARLCLQPSAEDHFS